MKRLQLLFGLIIYLLPSHLLAQRPEVSVSINKKKILIGEQINYKVNVTMLDNLYKLTWFTIPSDFGAFVVASSGKIDSSFANGILGFSQQLELTSFDSGHQTIFPLELDFESLRGDSSFKMLTDSIPIDVTFSPADSVLPFHDIKPIIPASQVDSVWIWWIIGAVILLLIILIIYLIRKKKKKVPVIPENPILPYDEALAALTGLQQQRLPEKEQYRQYFTALSDIVKKYISGKTHIDQMPLTGSELINELGDKTSRDSLSKYASCIRMGEAAKFAKYKPSPNDCDLCFLEMKNLIQEVEQNLNKPKDVV
ncbi:MAG: DUF4381 family protein [Chitinophagaceae bacterium]|nr:DUF4381 family protein [Chitinophagaceae bacterium]